MRVRSPRRRSVCYALKAQAIRVITDLDLSEFGVLIALPCQIVPGNGAACTGGFSAGWPSWPEHLGLRAWGCWCEGLRWEGGAVVDVFVSHAGRDRPWAEWVAWQLEAAGLSVELDYWDWKAGENFVARMSQALASCKAMVALFSAAYFEPTRWTTQE